MPWNDKVIIMTTLPSLTTSEVVKLLATVPGSGGKVVKHHSISVYAHLYKEFGNHLSKYLNHWYSLPFERQPWWRHQMEIFSALLAICAGGNSPVIGEFPTQRPVTRSLDVFFDLRLNKRLSQQSWGWWFETLPRRLWRHCNEFDCTYFGSVLTLCLPLISKFVSESC